MIERPTPTGQEGIHVEKQRLQAEMETVTAQLRSYELQDPESLTDNDLRAIALLNIKIEQLTEALAKVGGLEPMPVRAQERMRATVAAALEQQQFTEPSFMDRTRLNFNLFKLRTRERMRKLFYRDQ